MVSYVARLAPQVQRLVSVVHRVRPKRETKLAVTGTDLGKVRRQTHARVHGGPIREHLRVDREAYQDRIAQENGGRGHVFAQLHERAVC